MGFFQDLASEVNDEGTGVVEYMLLWSEYSYDVVLAALEFIYCDTTCRAMKLNDDELNDLEALSQRLILKLLILDSNDIFKVYSFTDFCRLCFSRYEINELEEHINLLKKLREDISAEDDPKETSPPASPAILKSPIFKSPVFKSPQKKKSRGSQDSDDDNQRDRTELSYLVSQMDKSTLLSHRKLSLEPETKTDTNFIPLSTDSESVHEEEVNKRLSQEDIFASLEDESDFCKEILAEKPVEDFLESRSLHERTITPEDDWRNLDGLDYLQSSPSLNTPRKVSKPKSPSVRCESPPLATSPAVSETPLEVVTLSSDTTSYSQKSLSPRAASPTTPARLPLDDSLDVFEDCDLTRLEMAALKAYEKVMTPKAGPSTVTMATPAGSAKVTPMADFSIMESPLLQV